MNKNIKNIPKKSSSSSLSCDVTSLYGGGEGVVWCDVASSCSSGSGGGKGMCCATPAATQKLRRCKAQTAAGCRHCGPSQ